MLSNQEIQNHWPVIKNEVLNRWSKLNESEVEKTNGRPNDLEKLVHAKYGNSEDFDLAYERICQSCSSSTQSEPSFVTSGLDDVFHGDSPERRLNANYSKVEHRPNINREADDELSAYSPTYSHSSFDEEDEDEYYNEIEIDEDYMHFTSPDEFPPFHNPVQPSVDIPLGREISSATKISTAKAASKSSEVSSDDAKKKS